MLAPERGRPGGPTNRWWVLAAAIGVMLAGCYGPDELADRWREQPRTGNPADSHGVARFQEQEEGRRPRPLRRMAALVEIDPGHLDAYRQLNGNPPAGVRETLARYGVERWSVFLSRLGDRTFAFRVIDYRGDNWELDRAQIETDPEFHAWQQACEQAQIPVSPRAPGTWWAEAEEIFRAPDDESLRPVSQDAHTTVPDSGKPSQKHPG